MSSNDIKHKMNTGTRSYSIPYTVCGTHITERWGNKTDDGGKAYQDWKHVKCLYCLKLRKNKRK